MRKIIIKVAIYVIILFSCNNTLFGSNRYQHDYFGSYTYNSHYDESIWDYSCTEKANYKINNMIFEQNDTNYILKYDIDYTSSVLVNKNLKIGEWKGSDNSITPQYQYSNPGNIIITCKPNTGIKLYLRLKGDRSTTAETLYGEGEVMANQASTSYEYKYYSSNTGNLMKINNRNDYLSTVIAGLESIYYRVESAYQGTYKYYLCKSGNARVTQNSKSLNMNTWAYNYSGILTIPKDNVSDYRYLQLNAPTAVATSYSSTISDLTNTNVRESFIGIYGASIDLLPYLRCENHKFEIINSKDSDTHKLYCSKCNWSTTEKHNFLYTYDNIENNICTCSFIKKVKNTYIINDDYISTVSFISNSNSLINTIKYTNKTGYIFKYYEKYENIILDGKENLVFVSTSSEINNISSYYSSIIKAIYEPINYYFEFENINNLNLQVKGKIGNEKFLYDEIKELNDNLDVDGYSFEGWSLDTDFSCIDFKPNERIINYSEENNRHFIVYPNYKELVFTVLYNTGLGKFSNKKKQIEKTYKYLENIDMELPFDYRGGNDTYFVMYTDKYGNHFYSIEDIKKYINSNHLNNAKIVLNAVYDHPGIASSERTNGDNGNLPGNYSIIGEKDKVGNIDVLNQDIDNEIVANTNNSIEQNDCIQSKVETKSEKTNLKKILDIILISNDKEIHGLSKSNNKEPSNKYFNTISQASTIEISEKQIYIKDNLLICLYYIQKKYLAILIIVYISLLIIIANKYYKR